MKKAFILMVSALVSGAAAFAEEPTKQIVKPYGFIRTYFAFDTRESEDGTEDLFYYMPLKESINEAGLDVNQYPSFRFATITSRVGLDINGGEVLGYKLGGKIETDFYLLSQSTAGKVTGAGSLRLRQAYATVAKDNRSWKVGQAWHPFAVDLPDMLSLDTGIPFAPFSRTPQVMFDWRFAGPWSLSAAAIWQMQYTSPGPDGAVADYIKNGLTPELYLAFNRVEGGNIFRAGADVLSIKPRKYTVKGEKASDRLTSVSFFLYGQYRLGNWSGKSKAIFANDCSHINMVGGYGVSGILEDGSYVYSPTRSISINTSLSRKVKDCPWTPQIFLAFAKQFGTADAILSVLTDNPTKATFYEKLNASTVNCMWRVQPEILYTLGKLQFGVQCMYTGVSYGRSTDDHRRAQDLYTVGNVRIQGMVKYTF